MEQPDEPSEHRLGFIVLDPDTNQYHASCSCRERFGPLLNAGMIHAAFDAHRRGSVPPPASPNGH